MTGTTSDQPAVPGPRLAPDQDVRQVPGDGPPATAASAGVEPTQGTSLGRGPSGTSGSGLSPPELPERWVPVPVQCFLQLLNLLLLIAYGVGLSSHSSNFEPLVDGLLGTVVFAVPTLSAWLAVLDAGPRRREATMMALALSSFALGNLAFVLAASTNTAASFPAPSDLGYLAFYPLAAVAIGLATHRELRTGGGVIWLDSLLGSLGAAAVLAVLLERVVALATGQSLADGLALIYPIGDLLLVAVVLGVLIIHGRPVQRHWLPLLVGLALFAVVDTLAALALATDSYALGSMLDLLWPTAIALISLWNLAQPTPVAAPDRQAALVVPCLATIAALSVLIFSGRREVSTEAVALATLTVVASGLRTQMAFRQLRRLADLRRQATTDELTGLANRRAFYALAEAQLTEAPHRDQALLLLDLDRFKEVNDSLGHLVGDQLLVQISQRLQDHLRADDLLARLGGDEFAILLADTSPDQAVAVAIKLRAVVAEPCTLEGIMLRTDVSIGLAFVPEHGHELSGLLRRADIAMYEAKRGRNGHRIYSGLDDAAGASRLRSIQELHLALTERQMTLHYQPKLDLASNQVRDVEALVRWDHPTRGLLYPDSFLSLVEDAGLMHRLTQFVLEEAMNQAAIWRADGRALTVAVNLSPSSLVDTDLPEQISRLLADRDLPPSALQLEITEEFLMADRDRTRDILSELRRRGIQIAVDDFGTGYSSLAYLRELPIDELKLDRSFVFPMADDARAAALVFSTIGLAHSLGLRMVAEGVENEPALNELLKHGCDQAQGYYISRPLPVGELDLWLERKAWMMLEAGREH